MLLCPKCRSKLIKEPTLWRCEQGHCYDIARRGYVHLSLHQKKDSGDDKAMVKARARFLSHGYYEVLRDALTILVQQRHPHQIIDAGCGEGYYTNHLSQACDTMIGFDLSKHAIDEACKAKSGVLYAVASVFHMPVSDACADMVLSVFAPLDAQEFYRVLRPAGYFIKVGPGAQHLMGLKQVLYEHPYENEEILDTYDGFVLEDVQMVQTSICLHDTMDIQALFHMTPYYWKTPRDAASRLQKLQELKTQIQFRIEIYRKDENRLNKSQTTML